MKKCTKCGQLKPLTEFWADKRRENGLMAKCKVCHSEKTKLWRIQHPDANKKRYWANRDSERERHLKKKYGITLSDYAVMLKQQNNKCAICGKLEPGNKTLDVDHDHATGIVRGLLCTSYNRMIGHAGERCDVLKAAILYLKSFRK